MMWLALLTAQAQHSQVTIGTNPPVAAYQIEHRSAAEGPSRANWEVSISLPAGAVAGQLFAFPQAATWVYELMEPDPTNPGSDRVLRRYTLNQAVVNRYRLVTLAGSESVLEVTLDYGSLDLCEFEWPAGTQTCGGTP